VALRTRIELWLVVLLMVLAFGAGLTVGVIGQQEPRPSVGATTIGQGSGPLPVAPPLTDEQIQQGLPPGHPDLSGDQGTGGGKDAKDQGSRGSQDDSTSSSGSP
jgi:hypothetical protein